MYEQDRFIVRLQQRVLREPAIRACFLSGSFGRGTDDPYSDIDIALVFADESARDLAYANRRAFVRSVLPYVPARSFDTLHVRTYFHCVLYSNGTKADYRYETMASLTPNPWDRDLKFLKDDGEWGERYRAACAALAMPRPLITAAELEQLDDRFWVMFWDAWRQLARGDHEKPFPVYLQLFTMTVEQLLALLPRGSDARDSLFSLSYGTDTAATLANMRALLDAYLVARARIVAGYQLVFNPDQAFERAVRRLVDLGHR